MTIMLMTAMIWSGGVASASPLREILAVKSVEELDSRTRESLQQDRLRETCEAELASKLIPRACFRRPQARAASLARICIDNARASKSRLDLSGSVEHLPAPCVRAITQRRDDLDYIDEAVTPQTSAFRTLGPELEESSR